MTTTTHPDRHAATLALRVPSSSAGADVDPPGAGSADCRVDLKLALFRARQALATRGTAAARARFAQVDAPELLAGTVQDGTARGVLVALEETISLCSGVEPSPPEELPDPGDGEVFVDRELRRKKDIVVASGGARIRWSRRGGVHFIDREHEVNEEDCLRIDDRRDLGDLDAFAGDAREKPRLFSPAFLKPIRLVQSGSGNRLELAGRLGRRSDGHPCAITILGRSDEAFVRLIVRLSNRHDDHRMRIRFLGCCRTAAISSDGTPGFESIHVGNRRFVAATLVRACGRLRVDDELVPVPGAQCHGTHRHEFRLGGATWRHATASKDL